MYFYLKISYFENFLYTTPGGSGPPGPTLATALVIRNTNVLRVSILIRVCIVYFVYITISNVYDFYKNFNFNVNVFKYSTLTNNL